MAPQNSDGEDNHLTSSSTLTLNLGKYMWLVSFAFEYCKIVRKLSLYLSFTETDLTFSDVFSLTINVADPIQSLASIA